LNKQSQQLRELAKSDHKDSKLLLRAADRLDELVTLRSAVMHMLKRLEWASFRQGPGSGYMFSGSNGAWIPACPICGNVHTEKGKGSFIAEARGHKPDCQLQRLLKDHGASRKAR
jgi:hypothetical protein